MSRKHLILHRTADDSLLRAIKLGQSLHSEQANSWLFSAAETEQLLAHKEERGLLSKRVTICGKAIARSCRPQVFHNSISISRMPDTSRAGDYEEITCGASGRETLAAGYAETKRDLSLIQWFGSSKIELTLGQTGVEDKFKPRPMAA